MIQKPSPNFDDRQSDISMIILHYTGMETGEAALERLTNAESKVSSHYTIDEDGTIYQHVDEDKRAWHAGASCWQNIRDINSASIGIEMVNPGHEFGYQSFPKPQIEAVIRLCQDIQSRYDIEHVLAHSDVAPDRKQDPGELFPWAMLAMNGIGVWPDASIEDKVKSQSINIYQALSDYGYDATKAKNAIIAFQRHYVPEAFERKVVGEECSLTRGRLYALLARHVL
jgi:N-acetylmuramoyl-L-alanine amidase